MKYKERISASNKTATKNICSLMSKFNGLLTFWTELTDVKEIEDKKMFRLV